MGGEAGSRIDDTQLEQLVGELAADELRNCSLIQFVRANRVLGIERVGGSVLVRGQSDERWVYVSSVRPVELEILATRLVADDDHFAAIEEWMVPILRGDRHLVWRLPMVRFVLPDGADLPAVDGAGGELGAADAPHVYEHSNYREFISVEYARTCVVSGPSVAIREEGLLVAWAMTQDDGAMGFLHVLEGHRHRGYGRRAALALAHQIRDRGRRPFAYVSESNVAAIGLVAELGFVRDRPVEWFQLR